MKTIISLICLLVSVQLAAQNFLSNSLINDGEKEYMRTGPLGCDYYVKDIDFRKVKLEIVPSLIAIISDTTQLLYEHRPYASSFIETISKGEVCARYVEKIIDPSFAALRIIDVEKGTYISIADLEVIANLYSQKWEEVKGLSRRKIRRVWRQNPPLSHSTFRWSVD